MTPLEIEIALHYWTRPGPYKGSPNLWTDLDNKIITEMSARHLLEMQDGQLSGNTPAMRAFVEALQAVPWPTMKWVVEPCPVIKEPFIPWFVTNASCLVCGGNHGNLPCPKTTITCTSQRR